jgi:hypothetical protein
MLRGGTCRYAESDASKLDPGSLEVLTRIGRLEESLKSYINEAVHELKHTLPGSHIYAQNEQPQSVSTSSIRPSTSSTAPVVNLHHQAGQPALLTASGRSEPSNVGSTELSGDVPPSTEIVSHASDMSLEAVLRWPIFTELAPDLARNLHTSTIEVLAKDQSTRVAREDDIHQELQNLSPQRVDLLVENFLSNNHVKNPVMDVACLRRYVDDFKLSGPRWDGKTCLVVGKRHTGIFEKLLTRPVVDCLCSQCLVRALGRGARVVQI